MKASDIIILTCPRQLSFINNHINISRLSVHVHTQVF